MRHDPTRGFAVWLTGLPASGKSTLAAALTEELRRHGVRPVVLESDALRRILTPEATYAEEERSAFYRGVAQLAALLVDQGAAVVIDATGNRRAYRDRARELIPRFAEVHVECPVNVCRRRDPKGIYRGAAEAAGQVPGVHVPYEPPVLPELVVAGADEEPRAAARRIIAALRRRRWVPRTERGRLPGETSRP